MTFRDCKAFSLLIFKDSHSIIATFSNFLPISERSQLLQKNAVLLKKNRCSQRENIVRNYSLVLKKKNGIVTR